MCSPEALSMPPATIQAASMLERDGSYRHNSVRAILQRLFPNTLSAVRQLEGLGADNFDGMIMELRMGIKVISTHEQSHFGKKGDERASVSASAIDGLYTACRHLAVEVMFRGEADGDVLDRLSAAWCTTMRVLMMYEETATNRSLKSICDKSRAWTEKCIADSCPGHYTWPFWKLIKACINWCCMFHAETDFSCPYGSPRLGRLLPAVESDSILLGLAPALSSWTYGSYFTVESCDNAGSGCSSAFGTAAVNDSVITVDASNPAAINDSHLPSDSGAVFSNDAESSSGRERGRGGCSHRVLPVDCTGRRSRKTTLLGLCNKGPTCATQDSTDGLGAPTRNYWNKNRANKPTAVVAPLCAWQEYERTDIPSELFDGPPFLNLGPLSRSDFHPDGTRRENRGNDSPNSDESDSYDFIGDTDSDDDDSIPLPRILDVRTGTIDSVSLAEFEQTMDGIRRGRQDRDAAGPFTGGPPPASAVDGPVHHNDARVQSVEQGRAGRPQVRPLTRPLSRRYRSGRRRERQRGAQSRSRSGGEGDERHYRSRVPMYNPQSVVSEISDIPTQEENIRVPSPAASSNRDALPVSRPSGHRHGQAPDGNSSAFTGRRSGPRASPPRRRYVWHDGEPMLVSDVDDE